MSTPSYLDQASRRALDLPLVTLAHEVEKLHVLLQAELQARQEGHSEGEDPEVFPEALGRQEQLFAQLVTTMEELQTIECHARGLTSSKRQRPDAARAVWREEILALLGRADTLVLAFAS